jgi:hypothetical protein
VSIEWLMIRNHSLFFVGRSNSSIDEVAYSKRQNFMLVL